jgi:hypothetical protein
MLHTENNLQSRKKRQSKPKTPGKKPEKKPNRQTRLHDY